MPIPTNLNDAYQNQQLNGLMNTQYTGNIGTGNSGSLLAECVKIQLQALGRIENPTATAKPKTILLLCP